MRIAPSGGNARTADETHRTLVYEPSGAILCAYKVVDMTVGLRPFFCFYGKCFWEAIVRIDVGIASAVERIGRH